MIPAIISSLLDKRPFTLRNNGSDLREYIHVSDVVSAYESIINYVEDLNIESAFNISSGERKTTREVFDLIQSKVGKSIPMTIQNDPSLEIKRQFMDSTLLSQVTGWKPKMSFEKSLDETISWYLSNL